MLNWSDADSYTDPEHLTGGTHGVIPPERQKDLDSDGMIVWKNSNEHGGDTYWRFSFP